MGVLKNSFCSSRDALKLANIRKVSSIKKSDLSVILTFQPNIFWGIGFDSSVDFLLMQSIYKSNQISLIHAYARKKTDYIYILQIRKLLYLAMSYIYVYISTYMDICNAFSLFSFLSILPVDTLSLVFQEPSIFSISAVVSQPHPNDIPPSLRCLRRPRNASCDDAASVESEHPKSATWKRWFGGSFRWFAAENGPPSLLMERKTIFLPLGSWDKVAKGFNEGASRKCIHK